MHEKNRPGWLALKARLDDSDVVALVANDLSRLHRKGWRIGDLIEYVNERNLYLMLAAPRREIDTTTVKGRMFLQFGLLSTNIMQKISRNGQKIVSPIARDVASVL